MILTLFVQVVKTSAVLSPAMAFLLIVSKLGYKRYRPELRLAVWKMLSFLLLLPNVLEKMFQRFVSQPQVNRIFVTDPTAVAKAFAEVEQFATAATITAMGERRGMSVLWLLSVLWIVGAAFFLSFSLYRYLAFSRNISRWSTAVTEQKEKQVFERAKEEQNITKKIRLVKSCQVSTPLLLGVFRPVIVLPEKEISQDKLLYIFRHELSHYTRKDVAKRWLSLFVTSLHWFNPLIHLLAKQMGVDTELACDNKVLSFQGATGKDYGYALLSFLETQDYGDIPLTTAFQEKNKTEKRFQNLVSKTPKRKGVLVLSAIILTVAGMTTAFYSPGQQPKAPETLSKEVPLTMLAQEELPEEPVSQSTSANLAEDSTSSEDLSSVIPNMLVGASEKDQAAFGWPVPGWYSIAQVYGWQNQGTDFHTGLDIGGKDMKGSPVVSAKQGTVSHVSVAGKHSYVGYGSYVIVDHGDDIITLYAHLDTITVTVGQVLEKGEQLGTVGETGAATEPHLHFEIREDGRHLNPADFY